MNFRVTFFTSLAIGLVGVSFLMGAALYSGIQSTARAVAPVLAPKPLKAAEQPTLKKSDRLPVGKPYYGRVLSVDVSVIL